MAVFIAIMSSCHGGNQQGQSCPPDTEPKSLFLELIIVCAFRVRMGFYVSARRKLWGVGSGEDIVEEELGEEQDAHDETVTAS